MVLYPAHDSEFGILDYCGFWKDEAWYLKSWWTDEPTLHIFPHWNLKGHEGDGQILGVGNGDPAYLGQDHPEKNGCKEFSIPAFNGHAQVLVQTGHNKESLRLSCVSDGLKSADVVLAAE